MKDIESRGLALLRKAKEYGILDVRMLCYKALFVHPVPKSEYCSYFFFGRATPENAEDFQNSLSEEEIEGIEINIDSSPSAFVPFDINALSTIDESPVELKFEENDDKIYLLDFWATWYESCQETTSKLQEMLENNPHWEGKVEVVSISIDFPIKAAQKMIQERGWSKLRSIWVGPLSNNSPTSVTYGIRAIPISLLIKNNKVLWKGKPKDINFEEEIKHLVEGRPYMYIKPTEPITKEEIAAKIESIQNLLNEVNACHPYLTLPRIGFLYSKNTDGEISSESLDCIFGGTVEERFEHIYIELFEKVNEIHPGTSMRYSKTGNNPV